MCVCAGGKLSNSGQITSGGDGEGQSLGRRALLARAGALTPVAAIPGSTSCCLSEGLSSPPSRPPPSWPLDSGLSLARGRASSAPRESSSGAQGLRMVPRAGPEAAWASFPWGELREARAAQS